MVAIVLEKNECFSKTIDIPEQAMALGLEDSTDIGFEGRVLLAQKEAGVE